MTPPEKPKTKSLVVPAETHAAVNAVADDANVTIQVATELLVNYSLSAHSDGKFAIVAPTIQLTETP